MKYFDGHNDVLLKFYFEKNKDSAKEFFNGNVFRHIFLLNLYLNQ